MKIITSQEMRVQDRRAIHECGIPSLVLMENAGKAAAHFIVESLKISKEKQVFILCGKGNNGGDGFVVARHLFEKGYRVIVCLLYPSEEYQGDAKINLERFAGDCKEILHPRALRDFSEQASSASILVDAIFGIGLNRNVEGRIAKIIQAVNLLRTPIVSLDIPSGLNADTGEKRGIAVHATYTCSFHLPKIGLLLGPDVSCVGQLQVFPIGIPKSLENKIKSKIYYNSPEVFKSQLRPREKNTYKNKYGHVLTLASSRKKLGAGLLTARAALRAGAGLSTLALPECAYEKVDPKYAEIMFEPLASQGDFFSIEALSSLKNLAKNKKVLACGPGMGTDLSLEDFLRYIILDIKLPMVLDADALNNLVSQKSILRKKKAPIVITPHPGEMQRLTGMDKRDLLEHKIEVIRRFAKQYQVYVVLKGYRSLIANPQGDVYVNGTGNPGMATAGTGDVLTGVIAGLIAQDIPFEKAILAGVWIHARAGDKVAEEKGETGMLAWDIAEKIPEVIKEIHDGI